MALDPKSAAKLGESFGKGLTDSVFGIVDTVRNAKNIKQQNTQKIANQNKITDINNQVVRMNNALREQAMREIAAEQEKQALMKMSPAQREAYYKMKAEQAKEAARIKREAEQAHEEMMEMIWVAIILLVGLPLMIWFGLLIWGATDVMACYKLKSFVPLVKAFC